MLPERWAKVNQLFYAALERNPDERDNFLEEECADDRQLCEEVKSLLAAHQKGKSFIQKPVVNDAVDLLAQEYNHSMDSSQDLIGRTLSHYRIIKRLGAGGMGEVYLAEDTRLDRKIALKILPTEVASNPDRMKRFSREAKAASAIDHSNIVHIYEINQAEGLNFIAMQYVEGETLDTKIRGQVLSIQETLEQAIQIADAIAEAHLRGIIHRDLKPANVIISKKGNLKLLDFGLARIEKFTASDESSGAETLSKTMQGTVLGTFAYMSPEQALGKSIDNRTDIFSMGTMFYEMVTGKLPFFGNNPADTIDKIVHSQPAAISVLNYNVPTELERIIRKCMEKDPANRYQSSSEILIDLRNLKRDLDSSKGSTDKAAPSGQIISPNFIKQLYGLVTTNRIVTLILLAFSLLAIGISYWFIFHHSQNVMINSVAVMPFENVTHDKKIEYLSDGVTESLINSFSKLPHVKVIARSSVFSYKNQTPDLQEVARRLKVRAILTGRVLMQGDTLDVQVELMDAQSNIQLWGDHYTRKAADIFAVQDEIARQVTDSLRVRLTGGQQEQVTKHYTDNPDAYRLYLQGRYYLNYFSEENLKRAVPLFDQALALDPRYALAYAGRAEVFFNMGDETLSMKEAMSKAKQDTTTALSIDENLAQARMTLAVIKYQYDWDFVGAEKDFKQVMALNPNYAEGHHQYAWYLALTGKEAEAIAEMKTGQQLDPVNPIIDVDSCLPYMFARQFDKGIAQSKETLEMFPNFRVAHMTLGNALFLKGDYSAGIQELKKAEEMEPIPQMIGNLGYAYAKAGFKNEAYNLLTKLNDLSKHRYVSPYWVAMIYVGLGDKDDAFAWLEKAYEQRSFFLLFAKMDPMVDSLRSDPRFTDLIRRIGFP